MMAEYIEREALLRDISESVVVTVRHGKPSPELRGVSKVIDRIKSVPTADVAEVRHGVWLWDVETHGDPMYGVDEDFGYRCSGCEIWADEWGVDGDIYEEPPTRLHYCPNCGAKMDGKGDGDADR